MAENCKSLTENLFSCTINNGGLSEMYVFDMDDVEALDRDEDTHLITRLELSGAPAQFKLVNNSASYTDEMESELTNQAVEFTQTLNVQRNVRNATNSHYFKVLAQGLRYLGIIIKDNNGKYLLMENAQLSTVTDGSGTVRTDGSKYLATFEAKNNTSMFFFDESEIVSIDALLDTGIYDPL